MNRMKAREGQWYADRSSHDVFCVIAIDEFEGLIDVRDRYGDIDEFDLGEWERMDLQLCAAPEGWDFGLDDGPDEGDPHMLPEQPDRSVHQRKSSGTT
jgi:hypothetical protein